MTAIYSILLFLAKCGVYLWSIWNPKAKKWLVGRKNQFQNSTLNRDSIGHDIWFHCASSGEFEQAAAVLESYRQEHPNDRVLLSFFSPSGFEEKRSSPFATTVAYLPLDTKTNARRFLDLYTPRMAVFIKYEVWPNLLFEIKRRNIPAILISGTFYKKQVYFKPWGKLLFKGLNTFTCILVQDKNSEQVLKKHGLNKVAITGDTRVDRVLQLRDERREYPKIEAFVNGKKLLILGSVWPADVRIILPVLLEGLPSSWKCLIAPHEISEDAVDTLLLQLPAASAVRFSKTDNESVKDKTYLILDTIGDLKHIYHFGRIAYIGGGFGQGIHNILEPAAHGLSIIFGPKNQSFVEARDLLDIRAAFEVKSKGDFQLILDKLTQNPDQLNDISATLQDYLNAHKGASERTMDAINELYPGRSKF